MYSVLTVIENTFSIKKPISRSLLDAFDCSTNQAFNLCERAVTLFGVRPLMYLFFFYDGHSPQFQQTCDALATNNKTIN